MTTIHRIALAALAAAVLVAAAAPAAEAQNRRRPAPRPAPSGQIQSVQVAPAPPQAGGGILAAPQVPVGTPTLAQLGSSSAYVPLKHGSTSMQTSNHVLASHGNLDMRLKAGMTCPDHRTVIHYSAKPAGHNAVTFVSSNTGDDEYSANVTMQPFSAAELETACQQALGGAWAEPGVHHNTTQSVRKTISKKIQVWGQCSGWANKTKRTYTVLLTLTCDDKSWFTPVG